MRSVILCVFALIATAVAAADPPYTWPAEQVFDEKQEMWNDEVVHQLEVSWFDSTLLKQLIDKVTGGMWSKVTDIITGGNRDQSVISDALNHATEGGGSKTAFVKDVMKTCVKHWTIEKLPSMVQNFVGSFKEGPYDDIMCDMVKAVIHKNVSEISLMNVKECHTQKTSEESCRHVAFHNGTSDLTKWVELLERTHEKNRSSPTHFMPVEAEVKAMSVKELMSPSRNAITDIYHSLKDCRKNATKFSTCFSAYVLASTCGAACELSECTLDQVRYNASRGCKDAVYSSCPAFFHFTDKICENLVHAFFKKRNLTPPKCNEYKCPSRNAASRSDFGFAPSIVGVAVVGLLTTPW